MGGITPERRIGRQWTLAADTMKGQTFRADPTGRIAAPRRRAAAKLALDSIAETVDATPKGRTN